MIGISLVLTDTEPYIGICPDPHSPPKLLASVVKDLKLPTEASIRHNDGTQTTSMSLEHLLNLLSATAERESTAAGKTASGNAHEFNPEKNAPRASVNFDSGAMTLAFAEFLGQLVKALNQSVEVVTAAMGQVNHVVVVLPPNLSAPARDKLAHIGRLPSGVTISTAPYHASVMLRYGNGKIPATPLVDLQWDAGLRIGRRSFLNGDAGNMARLGRDGVLCSSSCSLDTWHALTAQWLAENIKGIIPGHASWNKADAQAFRRWVAATSPELCEAVLQEKTSLLLTFGDWKHNLDKRRMADLRATLLVAPTKFLRASLHEKGMADPSTVLVHHGSTLHWPAAQGCLRDVLAEFGRSGQDSDSDASAALGALKLIEVPPCLPYDCGVLIRPVGWKEGTGTLVMLRGASAEAKARSRIFCECKDRSEDLEVLFYTRCVDFDKLKINYLFAEKYVRFAPAHDEGGKTNFYATMTLHTDKEGRVNAVRTVMHDKISGKSYDFPALAFTGGSADIATINRGIRHPEAWQWCEKIDAVRRTEAHWTVQDWRRALDPDLPLLSRDQYLIIVFGIETLLSDLSLFTRLRNAPPEQVQEQVRVYFHGQMTRLAKQMGKTCANVTKWTESYSSPRKDEALALDFQNSVYLGAGDDKELKNEASRLARSYRFGCRDPYSLRVDWNKKDFPL